MVLALRVPDLGPHATTARVRSLPAPGRVEAGGALGELVVELVDVIAHDCPPATVFRLVAREPVWVRALGAGVGEELAVGAVFGTCSTGPDEPVAAAPTRAVRLSATAVMVPFSWDEDA